MDDERTRPRIVLNLNREPLTLFKSFSSSLAQRHINTRKPDRFLREIRRPNEVEPSIEALNPRSQNVDSLEKPLIDDLFINMDICNDYVDCGDKYGFLLRYLPKLFLFIALMANDNDME